MYWCTCSYIILLVIIRSLVPKGFLIYCNVLIILCKHWCLFPCTCTSIIWMLLIWYANCITTCPWSQVSMATNRLVYITRVKSWLDAHMSTLNSLYASNWFLGHLPACMWLCIYCVLVSHVGVEFGHWMWRVGTSARSFISLEWVSVCAHVFHVCWQVGIPCTVSTSNR